MYIFSSLLSIACVVASLIPYIGRERIYLLEVSHFFVFAVVFSVIGKWHLLFYVSKISPELLNNFLYSSGLDSLYLGMLVVLIGLVFFGIGFHAVRRRILLGEKRLHESIFRIGLRWDMRKLLLVSFAIVLLSYVSFFLYLLVTDTNLSIGSISEKRFNSLEGGATSRLSDFGYYFYKVSTLAKLAFYILVAFLVKYRVSSLHYRLCLLSLLILSGFLSIFVPYFFSNRLGLSLVLVDTFFICICVSRQVPKKLLFPLAILFVTLFFLTTISRLDRGIEGLMSIFYGRYLFDIVQLTEFVVYFPKYEGFLFGETLVGWLFIFMPEDLLGISPPMFMDFGSYIAAMVFNQPSNNVPTSILGELYINFSWPGVAFGMLAIGMIIKLGYNLFEYYKGDLNVGLLYALITTRVGFVLANNDFGTVFLKVFVEVFPIILLILFLTSRMTSRKTRNINREAF